MLALYLSMIDTQEERDLFEQIYRAYRQDMYAVAYGILKNVSDAEDAVHEAFLKIADNFKKISQRTCQEIKPYVVIVCKNTALDMYRANKRLRERNVYLDDYDIPDRVDIEDLDRELLLSALKELSDIYLDVIYLHDYLGFSTDEVSELLSVSKDAIYKRLTRGRSKLRTILQKGEAHVE